MNEIMANPSRRTLILFLVIFLLSTGLRLGLVSVNRQSNDNHFTVIQLILETGRLPEKPDCWECYQPKLFHYTAAKLLQLTGLENAGQDTMILAIEMMNFTAGLTTLAVIGLFLYRLPVKSEFLKVLAFGLLALNPELIGISSQATNDTFEILFSTLALYFTYEFLKKKTPVSFLLIVLFTVLGISSKTNGWITATVILMALLINAWTERRQVVQKVLIAYLFGALTLVLSIINPLNQYISNYREYGSPVLLNIGKQPFPHFFEQTIADPNRPGIVSIQDGFLTFKFIDLLRHPRIEINKPFPAHMTSLWTELYGRAYSIQFNNVETSWYTTGDQGFALSRAIYILALLPTALLLAGAVMEISLALKSIIKRNKVLATSTHFGLTACAFAGYMVFIVLYTLEYRDYSVMKGIFLYPAIITFPLLFLRAGEAVIARLGRWLRWIQVGFGLWIVAIFILYSADIITMTMLIASRR
ncbi:MAG: glycosyltransferase family 39 protein [Anaerolineales bacterium]